VGTTHAKHIDMLRNFIKIALRNLGKNRVSSFINIGGLAMGMAVALLIGMWIYNELSYDKYHRNYERIARVMQNQTFSGTDVQTWGSQAMQLGPELRNRYGSNFRHVVMSNFTGNNLLTYGDKRLEQPGNYMEPAVIDMLSLEMIKGNRTALQEMNSIILSAATAKALFGDADPLGKVIKINNKTDVKVTGVYSNLPANCSFANVQFIAPWQLMVKRDNLEQRVTWGNSWFQIFVQIADNTTMEKVSKAIKYSKLKRVLVEDDDARFKPEIFLHPMRKWHLYGDFKNGVNTGGAIQYIWLFGITGAIVLLLACINFMNLSTARSEKRAKEVGIRKTIGSLRSQLIGQFYSESLVVALFAFVLSMVLVVLLLPFFNEVAGSKMQFPWRAPFFWLAGIGFSIITGLIAGSYPALYLSSFRPVKVLKGTFKAGKLAALPRKALVVVQFTASVTLIIATIIVFRQIQFAKNRPIGYDSNGLLWVPIKSDELRDHFDVFRSELLQTGSVAEVSGSEIAITNTFITNSGYDWQGKDPNMQDEFTTVCITPEFGKSMGWQVAQGRDFRRDMAGDSMCFVINESAARYMGLKDPVGVRMKWGKNGTYTIIGMVKDMITQSPYQPVRQMIFYLQGQEKRLANIKLLPTASTSQALQQIGALYKKYDPVHPFEYKFQDQEYAKKFIGEVRVGKLAAFFAVLAILISCLGLFGLASYVTEQRTKEIGVRKVLGASLLDLWTLLSREFVALVCISVCIAAPIAHYFMQGWLQNFEYRTPFSWWIFVVTGMVALMITLLTVSYQSVKTALKNPVTSLRTE
jgi:putative ABC transport system permease protein